MYVDSHSLGQLALASKRTASVIKIKGTNPNMYATMMLQLSRENPVNPAVRNVL